MCKFSISKKMRSNKRWIKGLIGYLVSIFIIANIDVEVRATEVAQQQNVNVFITQVDQSNFPLIKLYVDIIDDEGKMVEGLKLNDLMIQEKNKVSTEFTDQGIEKLERMSEQQGVSCSLVMDSSGSMSGDIQTAKQAATNFLNGIDNSVGDQVQLTTFDDTIMRIENFTGNKQLLTQGINMIQIGGGTALYDALYSALTETATQEGSKYIIAFTDGQDNRSFYTIDDVITYAKKLGIPIYMVGIGQYVDTSDLERLTQETSGLYDALFNSVGLDKVYNNVFQKQKAQYVISFTTNDTYRTQDWREIRLLVDSRNYTGYVEKTYTSEDLVIGGEPIPVQYVSASSRLNDQGSYSYGAEKAIDNDKSTVWSEGVTGDGEGEWLYFEFATEEVVKGMNFYNGHADTRDLYDKNSSIKQMEVIFSDGTHMILRDLEHSDVLKKYNFVKPVKTKWVKMIIRDTYTGSKYQDTCISEVEFIH